eukprot:scaffold69954_cov36-Attheya_sp.AAC.2
MGGSQQQEPQEQQVIMSNVSSNKPRYKRSRELPSPQTILDRPALKQALAEYGLELKAGQLDQLYAKLHRLQYPDLKDFCAMYRKQEQQRLEGIFIPPPSGIVQKNPVTKKNQNRKQLPQRLLQFLEETSSFVTLTSKVVFRHDSADGSTTKLAIELHDEHVVETVIMRYHGRVSLCVSSQVGCAMGCTFCATGTMGIRGNLGSGEILEQLVHAGHILQEQNQQKINDNDAVPEEEEKSNRQKRKVECLVRNVVFMGMGEPLNNYENVIAACKGLISPHQWNLCHGRVTVSTVGVTPRIRALTRDLPEVSLALSLHAPTQAKRSAIVPAAKAYPIEGLIDAVDAHMLAITDSKDPRVLKKQQQEANNPDRKNNKEGGSKRRRAMIEYVMLVGDTSTLECAHELGALCQNRHLVVNLIPYNQTDVADVLQCPSESHMREFQNIVSSYNVLTTIRRTMGADIASACGQLVVNKLSQNDPTTPIDIEDGPFAKKQEQPHSSKPASM